MSQYRPAACRWQHGNSFLGQASGQRYRHKTGSIWVEAVSFPPTVVEKSHGGAENISAFESIAYSQEVKV